MGKGPAATKHYRAVNIICSTTCNLQKYIVLYIIMFATYCYGVQWMSHSCYGVLPGATLILGKLCNSP
ncbi:hypothetical protein BDW22DRAFT_868440 [Trametopsis cervina]|nr:hypothetical protein BDW22DRAFT_868440 [Trametopsis cervina]